MSEASAMSSGTDAPALMLRGISKAYGRHQVIDGLDLELARGGCLALRGPNGAGKSTLLGCCSGAVVPDGGTIEIDGHSLSAAPLPARAAMRVLAQQSELPPGLTGRELLDFWAQVYGASAADRSAAEALVALGEALDRLVTTYSVGMRRRLSFAALAMGRARLFILDEPFAGLDAESRGRLTHWLGEQRARGVALLLAAHDSDAPELERLGAVERWLGDAQDRPSPTPAATEARP